ncbi:MAG: LptE family protein [Bacteroidales bacterium]|jgi:hypothetical protein|nr:LPS assembly lipoprotein LptE [Bacteroidales bacterium]MDD3700955.1 LptE family protein [Bacteroidales bacterium]MDY0370231.1 LptE family protein [Bacteroidales bacterium]
MRCSTIYGKKTSNWLIALFVLLNFNSCGIYSFTGATIPPEANTFSVQQLQNNALLVEPLLSNTLTTALRDRFMNQTNLNGVTNNGDLAFEGEITDYSTTPQAIQSDQTAALNRLSITVNIRFTNKYDESKNFESKFTQYMEYPSQQDLSAVKDGLIAEITEMLIDDIFNKAVVNW